MANLLGVVSVCRGVKGDPGTTVRTVVWIRSSSSGGADQPFCVLLLSGLLVVVMLGSSVGRTDGC